MIHLKKNSGETVDTRA